MNRHVINILSRVDIGFSHSNHIRIVHIIRHLNPKKFHSL